MFNKDEYWKNRKSGKRGQAEIKTVSSLLTPENIVMGFDNNGQMFARTRFLRRKKPATNNWHTKLTHSIKKKRNRIKKNAAKK